MCGGWIRFCFTHKHRKSVHEIQGFYGNQVMIDSAIILHDVLQ